VSARRGVLVYNRSLDMAGPKKKSTRARSPRSKRQEKVQTAADRGEDRDARAGGQADVDGEDGEGEHPAGDEGDGADADADLDDEVLVAEIVPAGEEVLDDDDPVAIDAALDQLIDDEDRPRAEPDDDRDLERDPDREDARAPAGVSSRAGIVRHDPLAAYIRETKRYPLLTREEEHTLAVKLAEEGDPDSARRLIEANLRLVVKIAYEYRRAYRNLLDLVQEGNIGLMQAVRKYDPYRGVKLSSYAAWWIRAYILKFILNNWRLVKIGTTQAQRKLFFNLRKEKERLEQLGFSPTPALLAENLDVAEKDVLEMDQRLSAPDASLDAPMTTDDEGGTRTRMDLLPNEESDRPDRQVAQSQFQELLRSKLERFAGTLEGRDATIFRERWLTDSPLTLQQIGDRYGVTRERARQLEKRMLSRLRKFLEKELGTIVDIDALSRD
jgi:RNA polymerase sigma-32 factor